MTIKIQTCEWEFQRKALGKWAVSWGETWEKGFSV